MLSFGQVLTGLAANVFHNVTGRCPVCGNLTLFLCTNSFNARNNMHCLFCRSLTRRRHIAKAALEAVFNGRFKSFANIPKDSPVRIYSADAGDSTYWVLKGRKNFTCSEFKPGTALGQALPSGATCQDLEKLTYPDASFDLVLTEDVLEHIKDHKAALREVNRVLAPGGWHVFTAPCRFDGPTEIKAVPGPDGDRLLTEPEYHFERSGGKVLVYRIYGTDLLEDLRSAGFETKIRFARYRDKMLGIFEGFVFISRKTV